ncbi:MAG: copper resistance protein CopC [Chloroflexi bacterium]|nr:copper resistance protein CopC [Chloroflexota bacterium]
MRRVGAWRRAGAIALLALLVGPALPDAAGGRVLAHAQLVTSSPAPGSTLPEPPTEIRLVFSEPLETQFTSLDLVTDDGTAVLERGGLIDPADPFALVATPPELEPGVYTVRWRTLSAADGHTAEGFLAFGVGDVSGEEIGAGGEAAHEAADPSAVIGRWLTYIGLLLALGLAVFHRVVVRDGAMPRLLTRGLAAALLISGVATLGAAAVSGLESGDVGGYLVDSRNGALQLGRAAVAVIGGVGLALVPLRWAGTLAGGTGIVGIVLLVLAGHASGIPGPAAIASQLVHVSGAAVWIGGIVGLVAVTRRPSLVSVRPLPSMRTLVPRFSALALVSIGLVVLTGVHSAYVQTGVLLDLETEYGHTLLMKSGFAIGALALGALNFLDGGRMMTWLDSMRSRLTIELMLATTVLVMTAALASTPPVDEPLGVAIEPIPDAFGVTAPGMTMDVVPGRPGLNRVIVTTTDALAASTLELGLDRRDDGTTTRVPLLLEGGGTGHGAGADHGADTTHGSASGTATWTADALVLPAGSQWDASVRIVSSSSGAELARQRFAFGLSDAAIDSGRVTTLVDPVSLIGVALLLGGALGVGLGLGGASLPRCEPAASRVALLVGGATATALGTIIGAARLVA